MNNKVIKLDLSETAATYIRESIMTGEILPGNYVRVEQVAEELGLSATPIRQALYVLSVEGFVELDAHKGFRVLPLSQQDVLDIFQLLAFVSGELCARAATTMREWQIEELEKLQAAMDEAAKAQDWAQVEHHNKQFHRLINLEARSDKLVNVVGLLTHYIPRRLLATGVAASAFGDHVAILDALKRSSPGQAREAMSKHVAKSGELLGLRLGSYYDREAVSSSP